MFGGGSNPLAAAIKKQRKQESDEVNISRAFHDDIRVRRISAFHVWKVFLFQGDINPLY